MMKKQTFALGLLTSALVAAPAMAQSPKQQPDDSWVSISGTVVDSENDEFTLDYGHGQISVETDDWEWYGNELPLLPGDVVTVYGQVEKHLFVDASIEADSIYVESLGTYFHPSPAADVTTFTVMDVTPVTPVVVGNLVFTGTVENVKDREFTINTGDLQLTVDTSDMENNPLDDQGRLKVEKGDTVSVLGDLGTGVIGDRKLQADSIVILEERNQQNQQNQNNQQQQKQSG
ncbi:OB fold (BOF) protein [Halopseudomonas xinjiangensis]|uniref:OB fold (BOF) protein n=1 Tax=Halopseudomonas xinjiangensis TaxID=487184 RepID=A0A1H1SET0_9GAMM|nr:NirD/YgiW/YdeI family stress tolerance protein [Halopseudomonas xinjiangensis]SDS45879.1 OB fold (BOF) protein [Halopseudomonas xinjiangensis]